jgi:hypothetical protein
MRRINKRDNTGQNMLKEYEKFLKTVKNKTPNRIKEKHLLNIISYNHKSDRQQ